jgi:hypothetical protein
MATKKFTDIIIPKSWFKKTCSEPVAGSSSFLCWLEVYIKSLPVFADDEAALNGGLEEGDHYVNSTSGAITIVGAKIVV